MIKSTISSNFAAQLLVYWIQLSVTSEATLYEDSLTGVLLVEGIRATWKHSNQVVGGAGEHPETEVVCLPLFTFSGMIFRINHKHWTARTGISNNAGTRSQRPPLAICTLCWIMKLSRLSPGRVAFKELRATAIQFTKQYQRFQYFNNVAILVYS